METTTFLSVLPLRLTMPQQDMAGMLSSWMDNSPSLGLSSLNCGDDLETIDRLRRDIAQSLGESKENAYEEGSKILGKIHEYYNYLLECEEHGMVQDGESSSLGRLSIAADGRALIEPKRGCEHAAMI